MLFGTILASAFLKDEGLTMNEMTYFDRLVASTQRIARHAWHPGKDRAVEQCVDDIEGLVEVGRITPEQGDVLRDILLEACQTAN